ncbi:MAG: DUF4956 domain-containing protein [Lachnospiraceae bacterium]|nr:DUF4956 domain-containing protein [Lachnospiraceae bacterium]
MFDSIISESGTLSLETALICTGASLVLGLVIALVFMKNSNCSKSYLITLVLMPMLVEAVIMMVNGNLGTAVGVMGAFSLVRFRSMPGTSREIMGIFLAMAVGVATGTGYIGYAAAFTLIACLVLLILETKGFGNTDSAEKELKITIPESLDYTGVFDDIFNKYTGKSELMKVKTTNMGSMYDLSYRIRLLDAKKEKEFIDELRTRNGNLGIMCGRISEGTETL